MKEPLILSKIAEVIRTCPLNENELEEYYSYICNWANDKSEIRLLEYLIRESKIIGFGQKDLPIDGVNGNPRVSATSDSDKL